MKPVFINIGLVFTSLLICFICIELIARLFLNTPSPYTMRPGAIVWDTQGFWAMEPNRVDVMDNNVDIFNKPLRIEANSARHTPCGANLNQNNPKLYLIGDSQTFGWGLSDDETWANHLQCALKKNKKNQFKVINLGVPGIQVDQYVVRGFSQVAPAINTGDAVVISITWNDLIGFYKNSEWVNHQLLKAELVQVPSDKNEFFVTGAPNSKTPLAAVSKHITKPIEFKSDKPSRPLNPATWRYGLYQKYGIFIPSISSLGALNQSLHLTSAIYRVVMSSARLLFYRLRPSNSLFEKIPHGTFEGNFLSLKALSSKLESRGANVLIQLLPNRLFYDDYYYESYSKNGFVFPDRNYMKFVATPFCKSLKLNCVDRFSDLKTSITNAHNFPFDGHYNPTAAARIGDALALDINAITSAQN
jgi:hypothetical protein